MELPDLASLPSITKFIERCIVVTIPAGAAPKDVTIQLPDADGAKVPARYTGNPPGLAVNNEVVVRATPQDTIKYVIDGTSGATVAQGGNPFDHILFVSSTNPNADHATIALAIAAASAGDIILLDAETWAGGAFEVNVSKAVTLMGLDPVNTILTATATETVRVTATGVSLRNLTIANTGTSTNSNCISDNFSGSNNLLIDNCILNKISGAATNSRGIRNTGGTGWEIRNCRITVTAGITIKYGYGADTAASSAKITNSSIEGSTDDINLNHAGASVELVDPILENNILTLTAGTATGQYRDANNAQIKLETNITGATTLTSSAFGRVHRVTGTSADYTITLPVVSGEDGRWISFIMDDAMDKVITLDGNSTETINGATTQKLVANEAVTIEVRNGQWYAVEREVVPTTAQIKRVGTQSINNTTLTKIQLNTLDFNTVAAMTDIVTNYRITFVRSGAYIIKGFLTMVAATYTTLEIRLFYNGVWFDTGGIPATPSRAPVFNFFIPAISANDYVELYVLQISGAARNLTQAVLNVLEVPQW